MIHLPNDWYSELLRCRLVRSEVRFKALAPALTGWLQNQPSAARGGKLGLLMFVFRLTAFVVIHKVMTSRRSND